VTAPSVEHEPTAVTSARALLALVAVFHLLVPLYTLTHLSQLTHDIATDHPGGHPASRLATSATVTALAVHLPLLALTGFLAVALRSAHPWTRRPATVSQLFGIAFAAASTPPLHALHPLVPLAISLSTAVVVLLWAPAASRSFFASHPRRRRPDLA
jgi:uncharacterized membrane protein